MHDRFFKRLVNVAKAIFSTGLRTVFDLMPGMTPFLAPLDLTSTDHTYFAGAFHLESFIPLVILMFRIKDGGIRVVAKKRSAIGTFF
jgi:hypothetical protein